MLKRENRPGVAAPERESGIKTNLNIHSISASNYSLSGLEMQALKSGVVWELLGTGKEQARTGAELCKMLGVNDVRLISREVELERHAGFPILASTDPNTPGYFRPETISELEAYLDSFDRRLKNMMTTRDRLQETWAKLTNQEIIPEWGQIGDDW